MGNHGQLWSRLTRGQQNVYERDAVRRRAGLQKDFAIERSAILEKLNKAREDRMIVMEARPPFQMGHADSTTMRMNGCSSCSIQASTRGRSLRIVVATCRSLFGKQAPHGSPC